MNNKEINMPVALAIGGVVLLLIIIVGYKLFLAPPPAPAPLPISALPPNPPTGGYPGAKYTKRF